MVSLGLAWVRRALILTVTVLLSLMAIQQQQQVLDRLAGVALRTRAGTPSPGGEASSPASCSCLNSLASSQCCRRSILRAHKFGYLLANQLFKTLRDEKLLEFTWEIAPSSFPSSKPSTIARNSSGGTSIIEASRGSVGGDYRHVILARNFYEAFVSGYLYHKSGRECWLSEFGRKWTKREKLRDWKSKVRKSQRKYPHVDLQSLLTPASNTSNVSLCRFLADHASEEDGMQAYIAFALSYFYPGLLSYLQIAAVRNAQAAQSAASAAKTTTTITTQKSLVVCFDEVTDPRKMEDLYYEMMDFLYPGGHNFTYRRRVPTNAGGHASDPDPVLRRRLLEIVKRLDRTVYGGDLTKVNDLIACNGTIH
jgi:hypothetical protein